MPRRRRNFEDLTADYQARLLRFGITPSQYETGAPLQRARGHRPQEHRTRAERNPQSLSSSEYRFLKQQQIRATPKGAPQLVDFSRQLSLFKRMPRSKRRLLMQRVHADHREYKRQGSKSGVVRGQGLAGLKADLGSILSYEPMDWENYDDIYADFDDDLTALLFYH